MLATLFHIREHLDKGGDKLRCGQVVEFMINQPLRSCERSRRDKPVWLFGVGFRLSFTVKLNKLSAAIKGETTVFEAGNRLVHDKRIFNKARDNGAHDEGRLFFITDNILQVFY
ncbi:hypothetical protein D3C80_1069510 [compost metagenome]